ncbi:MAG TPA: ATP-dependent DNA helicase [Acidimicrobiales bacterium]|nr:ATP-dependent DNA helicase [Acidimicrobiales bacterium]
MTEIADALAKVTAGLPGGGEDRPGQIEMAEAVGRAIKDRHHLVVQAGTGTGKSLAYLVPAILSGAKVIVSTATKALQDQLANHDLPLLQQRLGVEVTFAVLKGRSNYLCVQKAREVAGTDTLELLPAEATGEIGGQLRRLIAWARTSGTGDRAELDFEPAPRVWAQLSTTSTDCPGAARCPCGTECFAEAARRRAEEAAVVVVNSHLYGAHLASGGYVLPDHDVVVFDEAHELEDIAAEALGCEVTVGRFRALAGVARAVAPGNVVEGLATTGDVLEPALRPWVGKRLPRPLPGDLDVAVGAASTRLSTAMAAVRQAASDDPRRARAMQAGASLAADLARVRSPEGGDVCWVAEEGSAPVVRMAAVDVGERLSARLWGGVTAVLTSATVPPGLGATLGIPAFDALDVGSPFDYAHQSLLYCAADLPDPRSAAYERAMHDELAWLIATAGGRTLALFTSWRAMKAAAEVMRARLGYEVLAQDELPKPALLARFSGEESSCLFATMGFWQGVDVPGAALSLVTIDRIPFPRPDEPLQAARRERAAGRGFAAVDLPRAATLLAQGAGRLIRSSTDRGVVAVLDPRLASAAYRWDLVRALPPMARTRKRDDVAAFFSPRS